MRYTLDGLEPKGFFKWFEIITRIPHGSGHEEQLSAFLENFAAERNLVCLRDQMNNILIRVPATAGYENEPPILLQGHMDMVWAKDGTATIDLEKDPLELCVSGNRLTAKGTTLGADDGVAVATMLAIADDDSIAHPELELLCTVEEETGLIGIRNADLRVIKSRRMINFDAGNSHEICVSAVGAKMVDFNRKFSGIVKEGLTQLHLNLYGGLGGHAGILSHKNRACCINIMGELLHMLSRQMPVYLAEITAEGPSIHGDCQAYVSVPEARVAEAESLLQKQFREINTRYEKTDPNLQLEVSARQKTKDILSAEDSANIIRAMFLLHTGVRKSDAEDLSIIITSITFSKISLKGGEFTGAYSIRSLDNSVRDMWYYRTEELLRMLGFQATVKHTFTAWPGSNHFVMQERFAQAHKRLFGEDIKILHLHASIEVNILMEQIPDMDAVGIQPTAVDFHTPDETLFIDQVQPFWDLVLAVLAEKD
ncbi:MAG: beta-Ala-His dipeptidase [Oscillospiraceae bacterium]|nr:beta-Ala-His dipeptidase [Oscillospiraceae bacterium]